MLRKSHVVPIRSPHGEDPRKWTHYGEEPQAARARPPKFRTLCCLCDPRPVEDQGSSTPQICVRRRFFTERTRYNQVFSICTLHRALLTVLIADVRQSGDYMRQNSVLMRKQSTIRHRPRISPADVRLRALQPEGVPAFLKPAALIPNV